MDQFSDENRPAEGASHPFEERFSRRSALKAGIAAGAGVAEDSASFFFFFLVVVSVLSCARRTFVVRSVTENSVAKANSVDQRLIEISPLHEVVCRDLGGFPDLTYSIRPVRPAAATTPVAALSYSW